MTTVQYRLGTTLHWATLLSDGYRVATLPHVDAWLGWTGRVVSPRPVGAAGHRASIRASVLAAGIPLRSSPCWFENTWQRGGRVVLCAGPVPREKTWPGWHRLADELQRRGFEVQAQAAGSLTELYEQLRTSRAVIAVDSGPLHLAAYCGAPAIGLFTGTRRAVHGAHGQRSVSIDQPTVHEVLNALEVAVA